MAVVVKERVCRQCGARFPGGPRAWYCPDCRLARRREADRRYREKGRKADRPLGSTDICERCGKPYVVKSARQRYCPACAYEAVREADRPASRAWNQAHKAEYYPAKNASRRKERFCVICGAPITAKTSTITCSPACKQRRNRQRNQAAEARRAGKPVPEWYVPTKGPGKPKNN